ncbi:PmoA family protein [Aliifodinibius sp. S!AR15-10]|uniref:DUF6807 domain-containing protein n=1 Tax=Aliifodinibius sp. S!AR15-10 TaxID=2950437 RepID=UPI0028637DF1|nr:PmoA family protein [Aliifodinibius sp. S!AR15-10]MDR8393437.1 PmoA family protein [Aliifodinibius sp. S!AR15-10]
MPAISRLIHISLVFIILFFAAFANADYGKENSIKLLNHPDEKRVDVLLNGKLFTSYLYTETLKKPVLYPLKTESGNFVTRGYPLDPRAGERVDHPHHVGLWFNYGDVNGLDFWNNSNDIPAGEEENYGTIVHKEINKLESGQDEGRLGVTMEWNGPDGEAILRENTMFIFRHSGNKRIIDRITTLQALDSEVSLKDNKEGLLGIRVARQLEHPSDEPVLLTDSSGEIASQSKVNNAGVSGNYLSSEGAEGLDVWGTRARWMMLSGRVENEEVSLAILDHPENVGFPTYWHARGYGLFAANPLGQEALSGGEEILNFGLPAGDPVTFQHRIIIYSGKQATSEQVEAAWNQFVNAQN